MGSILSAVLLFLAFPKSDLSFVAWFSLVPFYFSLSKQESYRSSFFAGLSFGFLFFLFTVNWVRHVTLPGMLVLCLFLALYFGLLGVICRLLFTKIQTPFLKPLVFATCWVAVELIRSEIPVMAFGFNLLAYTQTDQLIVLQFASLAGAYGLSFLIAYVNGCIAQWLLAPKYLGSWFGVMLSVVAVVSAGFYGQMQWEDSEERSVVKTAVIQGNVPLMEWDEEVKLKMIQKYIQLTELAVVDGARLVLWPEAVFPGFFNSSPMGQIILDFVKKKQIWLMMGSPHLREGSTYTNAVYLIDPNGVVRNRYDKIHRVPFGEYVPFGPLLSFLKPYAETFGIGDFEAGKAFPLFEVPITEQGVATKFAPIICFEDSFPMLARTFRRKGAEVLTVVTNDAWFKRSSGPYQHLQASIFRAVENGVSLLRAANTGVSGYISNRGELLESVRDPRGEELFVTGYRVFDLSADANETLYTRLGYLFGFACLIVTVLLVIVAAFLREKTSPPEAY